MPEKGGEQHAEKRPVMKLLAVLAVLGKQNAGERMASNTPKNARQRSCLQCLQCLESRTPENESSGCVKPACCDACERIQSAAPRGETRERKRGVEAPYTRKERAPLRWDIPRGDGRG